MTNPGKKVRNSSFSSLLQSAAVYSASNFLNAAIPFFLLPILTRVLLPPDYGVLAMFNATAGILGAFTGLTVNGAVNVRFVDREGIDFPRYVGSCFCILLTSTLITLFVVAAFQSPLSEFTSIPPFWLLAAVLMSGGNFLIQIRLGIWMMEQRPAAFGIFQSLLSLLNVGLSLGFVLIVNMGYEGRLWGQIIAVLCFGAVGVFSLARGGWLKFRPHWSYVREALAYGVPLMPHVIGGLLASLADRFVINQKLGLTAAGVYLVAAQLGMAMGLLADAFNKAYMPWFYEHLKANEPRQKNTIVLFNWAYFVLAICAAGLVALLSNWIVEFVAGSGYAEAATVLPWLALGQAFVGMYYMVANYIFFKRKTAPLAWVTLVTGALGVGLAWLLIPVFGISGAGIAFAIATGIRFLLTWALAQRIYPMPWFSVRIPSRCTWYGKR